MIVRITVGGSFRGTLDYLMNPKEQGVERRPVVADNARLRDRADEYEEGARYRVIGGNMGGQTSRELAREFGSFRRLRLDIEKPVHHVSLSAAKGDKLSIEQWNEIAAKYVERMGFDDSPYVVIQHRDTDHDHIHLVTSRIDVNGRVVNEWQNKQRSETLMREVEQEYGLERVQPSREVMRAAPTRGEKETFERTGKFSAKMRLQSYVEQALKDGPTATEFIERLGRSGVEVIPNLQSTGRVSGISFYHDGQLMKGSDLGRGYSWGGLQKRGLDYDSKRDTKALKDSLKRVSEARQLMRMQGVERTLGQGAKEVAIEVAKAVGRHYLNQLNPLSPFIQYYNLGRDAVGAYRAVSDYLKTPVESPAPAGEQLSGEAVKLNEKEAVEQLRESAGMPRVQEANDALNQLRDEANNQLRDEAQQAEAGREQKPEPKQETERDPGREAEQKLESETEREVAEELETAETAGEEVALEETVAEEVIDILSL